MSFLLPSDMGRLIYGYLLATCSEQLAEQFLNTSDAMKECREYRHIGFNAEVHNRTLTQMLNEYSLLSDLIFENFNENERSHFNIVNTLQNLLKSRAPSSKISVPTDTGLPGVSRRSENTLEEPSRSPISNILSNALGVVSQGNDLTLNSLPFSKCSDSSPLNQSIFGSKSSAVTSTRESSTVNNAISENSVPVTSVLTPTNEKRLSEKSDPNTVIFSETTSQYRNTPIFGIAKSTLVHAEASSSSKVSSPMKVAKKLERDGRNSSLPIMSPAKEPARSTKSASSSSPLQNPLSDDMEFDDTNTFLNTAPNIPISSIQNNIIPEPMSSNKLSTPIKEHGKDQPERKNTGRKEINSMRLINSLAEKTPEKSSPKRHKSPKMKGSDDVRNLNVNSENSPLPLQSPKPVKILPKLPLTKFQLSKNYSPISKKNQSILARPTCTEPVPWDYSLRQAIAEDIENAKNSTDISKEASKNNRTKKDRAIDGEILKSESSKRKHDKKNIVCKKKKKLEEAKARAEAKKREIIERGHNKSEQADPLAITHDRSINPVKRTANKVPETSTSQKTSQPEIIIPDPPKSNVGNNDYEDEDPLLRRTISEEIVLYYKVSTDVSTSS